MKKIISIVLAGIMVLSIAGCGKQQETSASAATETSVSTEASVEASVSKASVSESVEASVSESVEDVPEEEETYSIKEFFAEHGLKAGTCLTGSMIDNKKQKDIILSQFSSVTMENAMKPDYILNRQKSLEAGEIVVNFNAEAIKMLDFAKENGLAVRGHTIVWYSQTPNWIFYEDFDESKELVSRDVMLSRLESIIKQIFTKLDELGYIDLFYAYDVANECWMEDGSMRQCNWLKTIGEDYLWYAFYYADKYAPESIDLYYNDYNEQFKATAFSKFVDTLVDEDGNYLIDGLGFQAHLYTSDSLVSYLSMVDRLAKKGLKIQLTELDVCLGAYQKPQAGTDANFITQGKFYYDLINGLLERVDAGTLNMDAITVWGFADALSWRKEYSPLLYNNLYMPKYSYYGMLQIKEKAGFEE